MCHDSPLKTGEDVPSEVPTVRCVMFGCVDSGPWSGRQVVVVQVGVEVRPLA